MPDDVVGLVAGVHHHMLSILAESCESDLMGLAQGARRLRGRLRPATVKRLIRLDEASHVVRHITKQRATAFIEEVTSGRAVTQPNVWQAAEVDRILRGYIDQAWAGTMTAEEALASADAEIQAILDEQP